MIISDNYGGEITAFAGNVSAEWQRKSINSTLAVRRADMMERSWTSKSSVIKLNFKGFSISLACPSIFLPDVCAGYMQFRWRGAPPLHDDAIPLKSCECQSKKPLIYSFYHTKTIFSEFSIPRSRFGATAAPKKGERDEIEFRSVVFKAPLIVMVTIILESISALAGAGSLKHRAKQLRPLKPTHFEANFIITT